MSQNKPSDQKQTSNIVFRKKTTSFSMVANPIIDNKEISPAAGWLYVVIQRWITFNSDDFVCSKSFIASKFQSGYRMFNRAWDELKEHGYLKMYSHPTDGWQAELLDEPRPDEPHTYYLDMSGEIKSTNIDRAEKKAAKMFQENTSDHYPQNDTNGDHYPQNDSNGNDSNGNDGNIINTLDKNLDNTNNNNTIYQSFEEISSYYREEPIDRLIDDSLIIQIKEQIEYHILLQDDDIDSDDLDLIVELLAEMSTVKDPQLIGKNKFDSMYIRNRARLIDSEHVKYVLDCFSKNKTKIHNIKNYLKASLFNAPTTVNAYYKNEVQSDLC